MTTIGNRNRNVDLLKQAKQVVHSHRLAVHVNEAWQQVGQGFSSPCLSDGDQVLPVQQHRPCLRLTKRTIKGLKGDID